MSRPTKHPKTGIYWLRRRVPADLVNVLGRKEITKSLETRDPDEAKRKHTQLLLELDAQWARLREGTRRITDREAHLLAKSVGDAWFEQFEAHPSDQLLWHTTLYNGMWTRFPLPEIEAIAGVPGITEPVPGKRPIQNIFWASMRKRCFDEARRILATNNFCDDDLSLLLVAKAVGIALQKASLVLAEYEKGNFEHSYVRLEKLPTPKASLLAQSQNAGRSVRSTGNRADTLSGTVEDWWREAKAAGRKPSTYDSYKNTFSKMIRFLGHDELARVAPSDVIGFKDHRLTTPSTKTGKLPSPKTVKDSDLSALKAVFDWARQNGRIATNPAVGITIKLGKPQRLRSKGLSDDEAASILEAANTVVQGGDTFRTYSAKRWIPWLCAFTGARVGEIAQLRKQDVFKWTGGWAIRITPEAGTTKTNDTREVPLHAQVIEKGFLQFVDAQVEGYLFLNVKAGELPRGPWRGLKNRLAEFARQTVTDKNVAPNHGWRHRFKTVGMEVGIPPRILDAIQGHAPRSQGDSYGDVTLQTMANEIAKLSSY